MIPACPACRSESLEPYGAEQHGHRWYYCSACSKCCLIEVATGAIVDLGTARDNEDNPVG